jgi:hypothetical protein
MFLLQGGSRKCDGKKLKIPVVWLKNKIKNRIYSIPSPLGHNLRTTGLETLA